MKLMLDAVGYKVKPEKGSKEFGAVSNRLAVAKADVSEQEFIEAILGGKAFTGGYFTDGKRKNESWVSQEVFALDFDENITIEEFMAMAEKYQVTPFLVYKSYSHTDGKHKFRAVFRTNMVITDIRVRGLVYHSLFCMFDKKADVQCKDAARYFFGTNHPAVSINAGATIDIVELVEKIIRKNYTEDPAHFARNMTDFCKSTSVNMNGSYPLVAYKSSDDLKEGSKLGENDATSIIYTIGLALNSPESLVIEFSADAASYMQARTAKNGTHKETKDSGIVKHKRKWEVRRNVTLDDIPQQCELARVFEEGEQYLNHNERLHLMSNYIHLEGGEQRFLQGLEQREEYDLEGRKNKARADINYHKAVGYMPTSCTEERCPFFHQCPNRATNILLKLDQKRGEVRRTGPISVSKSLTQAEQELEALLQAAYNGQPQVTVIKAPTGIGKTEMLTRLPLKDTMIAVPTHKLRDEVYTRLQQAGHNFLNVTERPAFPDRQDESDYMRLIQAGAYRRASRMLFRIADKLRGSGFKTPRDRAVIEYAAMIKQMKSASNLLVTHKRLVHMEDTKVKTIIIDEDILINELLPMTQVKGKELGTLAWQAQMTEPDLHASIQAYMTQVAQASVNQVEAMKTVLIDSKKLEDLIADQASCLTSNIAALFDCDFFVRTQDGTVHCIKKIDLTQMFPDVNIIIMSASANEKLYRQAFGQISFADIGEVQMTGKIVGHYSKGYSRHSLKEAAKFQKEMAEIKAEIGNMNVITYKGFKADVEKEGLNVVATFGATAGLDQFKGQDLAVIGTPHVNNIKYVMMAKALGVKVGGFDQQQVEYTPVRRNGYEFYFNTYSKNPMLQEIQFAVIESELIQAIGRARALRFNCTVHVFSNLPIY